MAFAIIRANIICSTSTIPIIPYGDRCTGDMPKARDLLRWTYLPAALAPDTEADAGGCFSGTALPLEGW